MDGGETVALADGVVTIPIPAGWKASSTEDGNAVFVSNGKGDFFYAEVYTPGAEADASVEVTELADLFLVEDLGYGQVELSDPETVAPVGSLVSRADMGYEATWTGNQGAFAVEGILVVAVRGDGLGLAVVVETPDGEFSNHQPEWDPLWSGAINSFNPV